jgi:hypothetical protein
LLIASIRFSFSGGVGNGNYNVFLIPITFNYNTTFSNGTPIISGGENFIK